MGLLLAQVHLPEVVAALERGEVVELVALFSDVGVGHVGGVGGEAYNAVGQSLQFHLDGFRLGFVALSALFLIFLFFLFLLILLLLGLFFYLFEQFVVLLAEAVLVVGVLVEEDEEGVVKRSP